MVWGALVLVSAGAAMWAAAQPIDRGDSYCGTVFTQARSPTVCDGAVAPLQRHLLSQSLFASGLRRSWSARSFDDRPTEYRTDLL